MRRTLWLLLPALGACSDGRTATLCPPAPSDHLGIGVDGQDTTFFSDDLFEIGNAVGIASNGCT